MRKLLILPLIWMMFVGAIASSDFDGGSNDSIKNTSGTFSGANLSLVVWYNQDVDQNNNNRIFGSWEQADGARFIVGILDNASDRIRLNSNDGSTNSLNDIIGSVNRGNWNYIWATESWTTRSVWLNGANKTTDTTSLTQPTLDTMVAGLEGSGTNGDFNGKIAYGQYFLSTLTEVEMTEVSWKPFSIGKSEVDWSMWGDSPEPDLSGNGNIGTVTGTAASSTGPPVFFGGGLPL